MTKSESEREFSAGGNTEHRGALGRQGDAEARSHPRADVADEKAFVRGEPFWIEVRRILMEAERLVDRPVDTNDHDRGRGGSFKKRSPWRDHLAVSREDDRFGRDWREIDGDLAARVVIERFGDEAAAAHGFIVS